MSRRPRIFLLDDNTAFADSLVRGLKTAFDVKVAASIKEAQSQIDVATELIISDIILDEAKPEEREGLIFLKWAAQARPDVPVIVLTGHGEDNIEVEALRLGAADYIEKEGLSLQLLRAKITALLGRRRERLQNIELKRRLEEYEPYALVGQSPAMLELRRTIQQFSVNNSNVFVTGESGSGKEVVARALHRGGDRKDKPFVAVNCAALSAGILESELFGHEKGSFTGAHDRRIGMFEKADGGVLLLDEVTEIDLSLQAKLLRALQEKQIQRVGGNEPISVDLKIIATTNRNPEDAIRQGKLREDLFYRLNVLRIDVPPLRHHPDDIPLLVQHFLERHRKRVAGSAELFASATIEILRMYPWPGNVRELENIVERACTLCHEREIPPDMVSPWLGALATGPAAVLEEDDLDINRRSAIAQLQAITKAIELTFGNKQAAQDILKLADRSTFRRKVRHLQKAYPDLWVKFPTLHKYYGK